MKLIKDLWAHLKEWSDWGMKDWIKAGIVTIVVLVVIYKMTGGGGSIMSMSQRVTLAQTQMQMATSNPQMHNL